MKNSALLFVVFTLITMGYSTNTFAQETEVEVKIVTLNYYTLPAEGHEATQEEMNIFVFLRFHAILNPSITATATMPGTAPFDRYKSENKFTLKRGKVEANVEYDATNESLKISFGKKFANKKRIEVFFTKTPITGVCTAHLVAIFDTFEKDYKGMQGDKKVFHEFVKIFQKDLREMRKERKNHTRNSMLKTGMEKKDVKIFIKNHR